MLDQTNIQLFVRPLHGNTQTNQKAVGTKAANLEILSRTKSSIVTQSSSKNIAMAKSQIVPSLQTQSIVNSGAQRYSQIDKRIQQIPGHILRSNIQQKTGQMSTNIQSRIQNAANRPLKTLKKNLKAIEPAVLGPQYQVNTDGTLQINQNFFDQYFTLQTSNTKRSRGGKLVMYGYGGYGMGYGGGYGYGYPRSADYRRVARYEMYGQPIFGMTNYGMGMGGYGGMMGGYGGMMGGYGRSMYGMGGYGGYGRSMYGMGGYGGMMGGYGGYGSMMRGYGGYGSMMGGYGMGGYGRYGPMIGGYGMGGYGRYGGLGRFSYGY